MTDDRSNWPWPRMPSALLFLFLLLFSAIDWLGIKFFEIANPDLIMILKSPLLLHPPHDVALKLGVVLLYVAFIGATLVISSLMVTVIGEILRKRLLGNP